LHKNIKINIMAIKVKSSKPILTEVPESLDFGEQAVPQTTNNVISNEDVKSSTESEVSEASPSRSRHKNVDNWGRPRKELIKGVKEVAVTVQLPETLIKTLRRIGKKEGKSMKELIGSVLIEKYRDCL
jgi:hypothetical protein